MGKVGGHYSHDCITVSTDINGTSDHLLLRSEAPLPQSVAQDHDAQPSWLVLFRSECPATNRGNCEHWKEVAGNDFTRVFLWFSHPGQHTGPLCVRSDVVK